MAKPLKIRFKVADERTCGSAHSKIVPRSCQNGQCAKGRAVNGVSLQAIARIGELGGPVAPSCEGRVHLAGPGFDI
eukprot:5245175-Prymnesium_polylepis.1